MHARSFNANNCISLFEPKARHLSLFSDAEMCSRLWMTKLSGLLGYVPKSQQIHWPPRTFPVVRWANH